MKQLLSQQINDLDELKKLSCQIRKLIDKKSIILLSGDLSAGKTTFVSNFCELFEIKVVQSPTYALHQRYSNARVSVDHFDLYRLNNDDEIHASGFFDLINSDSDYKFVEWPERVRLEDFPMGISLYLIKFKILESGKRSIDLYAIN